METRTGQRQSWWLAMWFAGALATLTPTVGQSFDTADTSDSIIALGSRRELFVDHFLIAGLKGAALALEKPRDEGIALRLDKSWEGPFCGYATVIQDGSRYRLYYRGLPEARRDGSNSE